MGTTIEINGTHAKDGLSAGAKVGARVGTRDYTKARALLDMGCNTIAFSV
jgi:hypothetical protein